MSQFVADTPALYWHMTNDARLSTVAKQLFVDTDRGEHTMRVPSIGLVEMIYLSERGKMDLAPIERLFGLLSAETDNYVVVDLDLDIVAALRRVPRAAVSDMPDRIIVATALHLGLPLISRDAAIRSANVVPLIW